MSKWLTIAFAMILLQASAQQEQLPVVSGDFSAFSVDATGHLYAVTSRDLRLKKYNPRGDSMGVFNDVRRYGKLTSVNTRNPLRTLLFYRDFRTIVILDRFLNPVNVLDLRKQKLFQVRVVAPSYDNQIWVFDEQEGKLKKIGESGRVLLETADLRVVLDDAPSPVEIIDQNGFVYLYDPAKGMFIFDYYGAMKGRIALLGWENVQVEGQTILGTKGGKWLRYTTGTLELKESVLPAQSENLRSMKLSPTGIFVLNEKGIIQLAY